MTKGFKALIRNKLVAFGIPVAEAEWIVTEQRIRHQWGPRKRDVEYLSLGRFRDHVFGLECAEHIARIFHNFNRSYVVDTTQLAMQALANKATP